MKVTLSSALLLALCFFAGQLQAQNIDKISMSSGGPLKPLQAIMDIRHYTIALDVDIDKKAINGYTEIELNLASPTDSLLFDFTHMLKVSKISVDNKEFPFLIKGDQIFITNGSVFAATKHSVKIYYGGNPPTPVIPPWESGFTWTKDRSGNPFVNITCQGDGGKTYFPCKDHPSDEPNEGVDLIITIPNGLSVAGPGLLQSVKPVKKGKSAWHWKTNYTISNYCVVFDIGKYKVYNRNYTTCEGNIVPIQLYILERDTAKAQYLLDIKERDAHILEKYFGEYPWVKEKIGIAEVPNSGMEHQTMITFSDSLDFYHYPGNLDFADVYYHEFAHEWWANKITNKDWSHMWVQEGIATYGSALAMREIGGEAAYDSTMLGNRFAVSSYGNQQPMVSHEGSTVKEVYNPDIYCKGAMLMHTLRYVLGDSIFFPTLKRFITNVKYPYDQFFTSDDVEQFFIRETGKDLKPIFDFYCKAITEIGIDVYQYDPGTYYIAVSNPPAGSLPLDIVTDKGIIHTTMNATRDKPFWFRSKTTPAIDPRGWYLRKVTFH